MADDSVEEQVQSVTLPNGDRVILQRPSLDFLTEWAAVLFAKVFVNPSFKHNAQGELGSIGFGNLTDADRAFVIQWAMRMPEQDHPGVSGPEYRM